MNCPYCHSYNTTVIDTQLEYNDLITQSLDKVGRRRRRRCNDCGKKWTAYELPLDTLAKLIAKAKEAECNADEDEDEDEYAETEANE